MSLQYLKQSQMKLSHIVSFSQLIDGFNPRYRMDRNANKGFIALYIREDISLRKTSFKNVDKDIRTLILDISSTSIAQKMKFSIKDFFGKYDQIRSFLWSRLLSKSLMKNFIFCVVLPPKENQLISCSYNPDLFTYISYCKLIYCNFKNFCNQKF